MITLLRSFRRQFGRDLKESWKKTALLGGLFVVGLCFWVPPLIRAVKGTTTVSPAVSGTTEARDLPAVQAETRFLAPPASPGDGEFSLTWETAELLLEKDPLVQSVEVAAIQGHPFQLDHDQFSPPVNDIFSEDLEEKNPEKKRPDSEGSALPTGLTLKSTIVGKTRRAAFINRKLYFEGSNLEINGQTYYLKAVFRSKVLLSRGKQEFELLIAERSPTTNMDVKRRTTDE